MIQKASAYGSRAGYSFFTSFSKVYEWSEVITDIVFFFKDIKVHKFGLLNKIQLLEKNSDFKSGLFLIFIGISFMIMSYRLGIGDLRQPESGFFPFWIAFFIFVMSFGLLAKSFIKKTFKGQDDRLADRINLKTIFLVLPALVVYGVVLDTLGFTISTFLFMVYTVGILGKKRWCVTLLIAFSSTLCVHLIFVQWLRCQFPLGFF